METNTKIYTKSGDNGKTSLYDGHVEARRFGSLSSARWHHWMAMKLAGLILPITLA